MEVSYFEIFRIDVTFYLKHVWKAGFDVLIKIRKTEYSRDRQLKG